VIGFPSLLPPLTKSRFFVPVFILAHGICPFNRNYSLTWPILDQKQPAWKHFASPLAVFGFPETICWLFFIL